MIIIIIRKCTSVMFVHARSPRKNKEEEEHFLREKRVRDVVHAEKALH